MGRSKPAGRGSGLESMQAGVRGSDPSKPLSPTHHNAVSEILHLVHPGVHCCINNIAQSLVRGGSDCIRVAGETVGPHLSGSGDSAWTGIRSAARLERVGTGIRGPLVLKIFHSKRVSNICLKNAMNRGRRALYDRLNMPSSYT